MCAPRKKWRDVAVDLLAGLGEVEEDVEAEVLAGGEVSAGVGRGLDVGGGEVLGEADGRRRCQTKISAVVMTMSGNIRGAIVSSRFRRRDSRSP